MSKFLGLPVIEILADGKVIINGTRVDGVKSFQVSEDCDEKDYHPGLAECTITFKCQELTIHRKRSVKKKLKPRIDGQLKMEGF